MTDAEWADVPADPMHRTGIPPCGDDAACRWIAVRHDEESIHVVVVWARQDGARTCFRDYPQVWATYLAAKQEHGLTVTAAVERTAATHTTRAEVERAARTGHAQLARDWPREQVQHAAAGARQSRSSWTGCESPASWFASDATGDQRQAWSNLTFGRVLIAASI